MTTQTTQTQRSCRYDGDLLDLHPSVEKGCLFFLTKMKETLLIQHYYFVAIIAPALFFFMLAAPIQEAEAEICSSTLQAQSACLRNYAVGTLEVNEELVSQNRAFVARLQKDCNLVIYASPADLKNKNGDLRRENPIWESKTSEHASDGPCKLVFQTDGNLVIYGKSGQAKWDTGTHGLGNGSSLHLQNDGNLVLYAGLDTNTSEKKWAATPGPGCLKKIDGEWCPHRKMIPVIKYDIKTLKEKSSSKDSWTVANLVTETCNYTNCEKKREWSSKTSVKSAVEGSISSTVGVEVSVTVDAPIDFGSVSARTWGEFTASLKTSEERTLEETVKKIDTYDLGKGDIWREGDFDRLVTYVLDWEGVAVYIYSVLDKTYTLTDGGTIISSFKEIYRGTDYPDDYTTGGSSGGATDSEKQYLRMKNHSGCHMNTEDGSLRCGTLGNPEWHSAQWEEEPILGTNFIKLRNRYKNCYLHIEDGPVKCGPLGNSGWHSAQWRKVQVSGYPYIKLKNRWENPNRCFLHVENGSPKCSEISPSGGWFWWQFERDL